MLSFMCAPQNPKWKSSFAFAPHIFLCAQPPEGSWAEPPLLLSAFGAAASGEHVVSKSLRLCSTRQMEQHHGQPQMSPFHKMSSQVLSDQPFLPKNQVYQSFVGC